MRRTQAHTAPRLRRLFAAGASLALVAGTVAVASTAAQAAPGAATVTTNATAAQAVAALQPVNDPTVIWREDFENGQGTVPTGGASYVSSDGVTYTSPGGWFNYDQCNGVVTSYNANLPIVNAPAPQSDGNTAGYDFGVPNFPPGLCTIGGYSVNGAAGNYPQLNVRRMADVLGQVDAQVAGGTADAPVNGSTSATQTNHAVTAWTQANGGSGTSVLESTTLPLQNITGGGFYTASVDVTEASCVYSLARGTNSQLSFSLITGDGVVHPINTSPIEACKAENSAYYTSPMPASLPETASAPREGASNWFNGGIGIAAGRYFSNGAILLSGSDLATLKVRMSNAVRSGDGNDFSFDNITLVRATPTLNKEFSPSTIAQGETSTLTFTIQNTSENAAKPGWSFTDDLPANVRIAAEPNVSTTCLDDKSAAGTSATVTADPGATTLGVLGGLAPGSPSCTVTVDVTSDVVTPEGQPYVNDKDNMTMTGLLPPEPTTLTVIPKVALSITKTADVESYTPGESIVYTVTVNNAASTPENPISTAVGASVSDTIPSSISNATWTCAPGADASCTASGSGDIADTVTIPAGGAVVYTVTGTVTAGTTGAIVNTASVNPPPGTRDDTCADGCDATVSTPGSGIEIVKKINGDDANSAPGVSVPVGSPLDITFTVTNTGQSTLTDVAVSDDTIGSLPADCTAASLAPAASFTCAVTYPAPAEGGVTHTNTGSVTGTPPSGPAVTDEDPANATTVYEPGISVIKKINGDDANTAPGVSVAAGSDMTVTFEVTNTGNVTLSDVAVTDDVITDLPADCVADTLAPGATFTCETTLAAPTGGGVTHTNTATVSGTPPQDANTPDVAPTPVTDTDPANATTTTEPGISVVKKINGDDANTAPGVAVEPGSDMTVTFEVTNTGNVTLTDVTVTDDVITDLPAECTVDTLAAGDTFTCEATLAAPAEGGVTHTNTGSVTGTPPNGPAVTD